MGIRNKAWEGYSKVPKPIQKHTDRAVRLGAKVAAKVKPIRDDTVSKGKAWVERRKKTLTKAKKKATKR